MKRGISSQDWQQLSEYIDGQLDPDKTLSLEQKIQQSPELKKAFLNLKAHKFLLKSLPRRKAPKNLTLSPEMLPVRSRKAYLFPVLNIISGICILLMVISFLIDPFKLNYNNLGLLLKPFQSNMLAMTAPHHEPERTPEAGNVLMEPNLNNSSEIETTSPGYKSSIKSSTHNDQKQPDYFSSIQLLRLTLSFLAGLSIFWTVRLWLMKRH